MVEGGVEFAFTVDVQEQQPQAQGVRGLLQGSRSNLRFRNQRVHQDRDERNLRNQLA